MEWVEVTGKTVDDAREKALDLLGVAEDEAEVEVVAEAKMGLFGRLREEARVRARVQPDVPRAKDERSRKRRGAGRPAKENDGVTVASPAEPAGGPTVAASPPAPHRNSGSRPPREARGSNGPPARTTMGSRDRAARDRASVAVADDEPKMEDTMSEEPVEMPVAAQAEVAKEFVDGLLAIMGVAGATTSVALLDEDTAELQVTGGDLGLLIGPKGATLLALQDLARTVVQRRTGARTGRLLLDVAGYRQKRKQALERFTQKVAEDVMASGTPTALEPMSSADRKIIHDTVNAIDGVSTSSEGEDPRRHVVVRPA